MTLSTPLPRCVQCNRLDPDAIPVGFSERARMDRQADSLAFWGLGNARQGRADYHRSPRSVRLAACGASGVGPIVVCFDGVHMKASEFCAKSGLTFGLLTAVLLGVAIVATGSSTIQGLWALGVFSGGTLMVASFIFD